MKKCFEMKYTYIVLLVLSLVSCHKKQATEPLVKGFVLSDKMLASTKTAPAINEPLKIELNFYGKITADNNKMIEVYPVVGGNVTKVFVELGDYVKKGQLLATIRSTEVAGFEKDMEDARNDVLVARNGLKVSQELYEGKLNTERDVIQANSALEKAQSQLQRIEQTYAIYNIHKGAMYEVRSPLSGFIIQKNVNQDMLLRNDRTDNIFDVAEIDDVWAIANVNEGDINLVKLGFVANVSTLSYPDKIFLGKVDKIYNIIDPETKAMKVRIKLTNSDYLLKPDMRANIKLSHTENERMLTIPGDAVIFDKSKTFVMVFHSKDNIETRQIEVFRQVGNSVYVSSGLQEGETVMITNQLLVYDALND